MNEFEQSVRETPIDKVNWDQLSEEWCVDLSIEFIRQYADHLNWTKLARYKKFSKDLIRQFKDKLDWVYASANQDFTNDMIEEFKDEMDFEAFQNGHWFKVDEAIIKKHLERFCPARSIRNFFMGGRKPNRRRIHRWRTLTSHHNLSEEFLREHFSQYKDNMIAIDNVLSKDYISDEFRNMLEEARGECEPIF